MIIKKRRICVLLIGLLLMSLCTTALAEGIDPVKDSSLTIELTYDGAILPDAVFDIYYIASVDENTRFTLQNGFDKYPIKVNENSVEEWNDLAVTLKGYVQRDKVMPLFSTKTDAEGKILMDGLNPGLYLVVGAKHVEGDYVYTIQPTVVCLPGLDNIGGANYKWNYDVTVAPKSEREDKPADETVIRKVLKVWDDKDNTEKRPEEISVQLFADGKLYDTVKLNAQGNWRFEWPELPACDENGVKIEWSVVEEDVENYTVKVEQNGVTFVVTNSYETEKPPVDPDDPTLPQTGLLWWPVPVLMCLGLIFIIAGVLRRRKSN